MNITAFNISIFSDYYLVRPSRPTLKSLKIRSAGIATVMQIEKALINHRSRVSKVS